MTANAPHSNPFSGADLQRRSEARQADNWQLEALADRATRFVLSTGTRHLVSEGPAAGIAFLGINDPLVQQASADQLTLLGWFEGRRCVLVELQADTWTPPDGTRLEELRPLLPLLSASEASVLACARALVVWQARHRHCGVCGAPTARRSAGHALRCTSTTCGAEFFPRIDPAVITLVSAGDTVLLGRQASWPAGRYSALAGFVEVGESLEDAAIREVQEESGVRVQAVRYFASQAWPFPSSMMVGFHAEAEPASRITLDDELEDARWFHADDIDRAPAGMLPLPYTIARALIDDWFRRLRGRRPNAG